MRFFISCFLPLSLLVDIATGTIFDVGGYFSYVRPLVFFAIAIFGLALYGGRITTPILVIYIFIAYVVFLVFWSDVFYQSFRISIKIVLTLLMFPVGFYFAGSWNGLRLLNRSLVVCGVIFILNFAISQTLGIGVSDYTKSDDFLLGSLNDSWNNVTYILILMPLILATESKYRLLLLVMGGVLFCLMLFGLKRSAIAVVLIAYAIYAARLGLFTTRNLIRSLAVVGIGSTLLLSNLGLFEERVLARGDKLSSNVTQVLANEGRYRETIDVWQEIADFEDPLKVLLGLRPFYSVGNYGNGSYGERQLHVDYNNIVNTTGIVGLILYFAIFVSMFTGFMRYRPLGDGADRRSHLLAIVFFVLLLSQFISSFGGQMYAITFRSIIFVYCGAILGVLRNSARGIK